MDKPMKRTLPVQLTADEVDQRAREHAGVFDIYASIESSKKIANAQFGAQLKALRLQLDHLSDVVKTQMEDREVECYEQSDYRSCRVVLIRADTHQEVSSRRMTVEEMQERLPLDERD